MTGIFDAIAESKKEGSEARALEKKEAIAQVIGIQLENLFPALGHASVIL